jgi:hypothetical protein
MPKDYELDALQVASVISTMSGVVAVADALARGPAETDDEWLIRYNADREAMLAYLKGVFPGDAQGYVRMTDREARERIITVLKSCIAKLEKRHGQ